jgi:hypothetical protein
VVAGHPQQMEKIMVYAGGFEIVDELGPQAQEEKRQGLIDAHLREYQGAQARKLEDTMDEVAATLKEEFGVDVNDVEGTRDARSLTQAVELPVRVERAVPDQSAVERAVAPPAKRTTATTQRTAAAIRGGRRA